jgi:hypothetical protein
MKELSEMSSERVDAELERFSNEIAAAIQDAPKGSLLENDLLSKRLYIRDQLARRNRR